MVRIFGSPGRSRRLRSVIGVSITMMMLALFVVPSALAVHDDDLFELGPAGATPTNIIGDGAAANGPDWDDLFDADPTQTEIDAAVASFGGVAGAFIMDELSQSSGVDRTTFSGAGGSNKNNDVISGGGDTWHWDSGNVPAKDDLSNAYAYATFWDHDDNAATPEHLVFFTGFERIDSSGDSHVDIEFFQDEVGLDEGVPCNDPGNDTTPCEFTGSRTINDLIVSMDYETGGTVGSVTVRRWDGTEYVQVAALIGEGCNGAIVGPPAHPEDVLCGFNNGASISGGDWPNFNRHGALITNIPTNGFTEFGVDVTELVGGDPCITTMMGKTRSSSSFTAELKDFAGPTAFPICGANIGITPDGVNEVGDEHTFTVDVNQEIGSSETPVPDGTIVDVTLSGDPDNVVDTCADPGTVNGTCSVTFTSDTPGTITGHASATVQIGGQSIVVKTDGIGNNSDDAVKRFVDAFITIGPDDTNSIGESHTFTANVQVNNGTGAGFVDAPDGTIVTVVLTGDADNVVDTCATTGTVGGECTVTFTSDTEGSVTAHASVSVTFSGLAGTVNRSTDGTGQNSGDATKQFVDGSVRWEKRDNAGALQGGATFEVCRTHTLDTATGVFVDTADVCQTIADDTDGVDDTVGDRDGTPGEFLLGGLPLGRYTVDETVAPAGFEPDPAVRSIELTIANPDATIATAFVNHRPILKITGFGYTNEPVGTPTAGVTTGTTTFTATLHNYGGAAATFTASSLAVSDTSVGEDVACTPTSPVAITGTIAANGDRTVSITCTYTGFDDGSTVTATLNISYILNGLTRVASGSPATITFTVQGD
jgi:Prealbumin-like fold domain